MDPVLTINLDPEADAAYVLIEDLPVAKTRKLDENRLLDLSTEGTVIGIEILNVSKGIDLAGLPYPQELARLFRDHMVTAPLL